MEPPMGAPPAAPKVSKSEQRRQRKQDKREAGMKRELLARLQVPAEMAFASAGSGGGGSSGSGENSGAAPGTPGGRHVFAMPSHRVYADTLARLSPWLQSLLGPLGGSEPVQFDGWPFAVVSFADAASAAAAAAAANRSDCSVEGDKPTGGDTDRRMLLVVQGCAFSRSLQPARAPLSLEC